MFITDIDINKMCFFMEIVRSTTVYMRKVLYCLLWVQKMHVKLLLAMPLGNPGALRVMLSTGLDKVQQFSIAILTIKGGIKLFFIHAVVTPPKPRNTKDTLSR